MKHVDVREAHQLQTSEAYAYVDVRSVAEFECGHPAGACNIPLLHLDPRTGQMMPNQDFLKVFQANYPREAKLLVGCQVGGRSAQAVQILESVGYPHVANVRGGFRGTWNPVTGRPGDEGWTQAGLPAETEAQPGQSYEELKGKAEQ